MRGERADRLSSTVAFVALFSTACEGSDSSVRSIDAREGRDGSHAVRTADGSGSNDATPVVDVVPSEGGALTVGHARIVFDTDMSIDVDDAGALAVLHALADAGQVDLLAVGISTAGPARSPALAFVDAVDTYYGRPDVPIALWKGGSFAFFDKYTADVAANVALFPRDLDDANDAAPDAAAAYRRILASEADQSVTMVCVGPMNNLLALLDSKPDSESTEDGVGLVSAKVKLLVQMGGDYPTGGEFNFVAQPEPGTTTAVLERWPTPIVFSGFTVGAGMLTGASLADTPAGNPVRRAYEVYTGMLGGTRQSWDLTAVLVAAKGTGTNWSLSPPGTNRADPNGRNTWTFDSSGSHRYLEARDASAIVSELNALLSAPPRRR